MGRNRDTNQKMKDERVEQILTESLKIFAKKGITATKISDICSATEISRGLIYHYFASKEDIYTELIRIAYEKMNEAIIGLTKVTLTPKEKIRVAIDGLLKNIEQSETAATYYLLISQATISDAVPERVKEIIEENRELPFEVITEIIRNGQSDGSFNQFDAAELAQVFWTSVKGLALHKAVNGSGVTLPNSDILMQMFLRKES